VIGVGSLMWASDYPHGDSVWPNSRKVIDEIMAGCSESDRFALTAGNAIQVFDLPFEV